MMIPFLSGCFLTILDSFLQTPLQTGKTLLAPVMPEGFAFLKNDVLDRTNPAADRAAVAFFIDPELPVHFRDLRKTYSVEKGQ